jgi:hypothetical protein
MALEKLPVTVGERHPPNIDADVSPPDRRGTNSAEMTEPTAVPTEPTVPDPDPAPVPREPTVPTPPGDPVTPDPEHPPLPA